MADGSQRVGLTLRLWGTGDADALDDYIEHLRGLLIRHGGLFERRAAEVQSDSGQADAVLVLSFPNGAAVDGFLRDPLRVCTLRSSSCCFSRVIVFSWPDEFV